MASEALVAALDLRDAERVAVRKRWREIQAWSAPIPAATTTAASTADRAAAIAAAIGGVSLGVGGGDLAVAEVGGSGEPTAEQVRERKQQEKKKQELQLAKHVAPFQAAAVCLQARVRGWLVRSCGGNAPMPMDWHAFAAGEKCPPPPLCVPIFLGEKR